MESKLGLGAARLTPPSISNENGSEGGLTFSRRGGEMSTLFRKFAVRLVREGTLEIEEPNGERFLVGDGTGEPPLVKIADERVKTALLRDPELAFGELYMDGRITVLRGSIYDVIAVAMHNMAQGAGSGWVQNFAEGAACDPEMDAQHDAARRDECCASL